MNDWVRDFFDEVDDLDAVGLASHFAEDGTFRLGNMPPVQGPGAIAQGNQVVFNTLAGLRHDFTHRYRDGSVDILEMDVTYTLQDGHSTTLPAVAVIERGDGDQITASRNYVDISPVAGRTAEAAAREWVQSFLDAVDSLEVDRVLSFFGETSTWTYANNPPMKGLAEMRAAMAPFHEMLAGISHVLRECFAPRPGVIVAEFDVTYTRHDGATFTAPASGVYELRDGLIHDYRVYVDVAAVLA